MGFWNYTQVWISSYEKKEKILHDLLECWGCDYNEPIMSADGIGGTIFNEFDDMEWAPELSGLADIRIGTEACWTTLPRIHVIGGATGKSLDSTRELLYIIYRISPETKLYYEESDGNNTSDCYFREEHIFDPVNMTEKIGHYDYCDGDGTARRYDGTTYRSRGHSNVDLSEWSTTKRTILLEIESPDRKTIQSIINEANKKGYSDLLEVLHSYYPFIDDVFYVTAEFKDNKSEELIFLIKDHGGNVCTKVTKDTTYVVANHTDYQSSDLIKAKELGIPVISESDLLKMTEREPEYIKLEVPEKVYLRETSFNNRPDTIENTYISEEVYFVHKKDKYDLMRVEVFSELGSIGYLPSDVGEIIAPLLINKRIKYTAKVSEIVKLSKRNKHAKSPIIAISIDGMISDVRIELKTSVPKVDRKALNDAEKMAFEAEKAERERRLIEQEQARKVEEERRHIEQEQARKAEEERRRIKQEQAKKAEEERRRIEQEKTIKAEEERKRIEQEQARRPEKETEVTAQLTEEMIYAKNDYDLDSLNGMLFVISGTFEHYSRKEIVQLIIKHDGRVKNNISKATNYIICNTPDENSPLIKNARKYGIEIISVEDFEKLIGKSK